MRMSQNSVLLKICKSLKSFTPFNKISSLCCAVAVRRAAMPMHPKQNLAAANRYGAPLFLRKSNQRFSLPFLRVALLCYLCLLLACLCFSVPLHSSSPHRLCFAALSNAVAIPLLALPLHIFSNHGNAVAMQIIVALRRAIARQIEPQPCHCLTYQRQAVLCLRESGPSMPCPRSQAFTS